jgi:hypothetical protein
MVRQDASKVEVENREVVESFLLSWSQKKSDRRRKVLSINDRTDAKSKSSQCLTDAKSGQELRLTQSRSLNSSSCGGMGELDNGSHGDGLRKKKRWCYIITLAIDGKELFSHRIISLSPSTRQLLPGELSILVEDGQLKLDFASLELRTRLRVVQGLDFASTPRFWLCVDPPILIPLISIAVRLVSFLSSFMRVWLEVFFQFTFFRPRLCLISLSPSTRQLFLGELSFLRWRWTAQARLCVAWVGD